MALSEAIAVQKPDIDEIVQRYVAGESIQTIAAECGVSRQAIYKRLYKWTLSGQGDKNYHELVTEAMIQKIADADELLASADNAVDIARAREMARFSRMDLERRRPHLYGPKQEIKDEKTIVVIDRRLGISGPIENHPQIEAQVIDVTSTQPAISSDTVHVSSGKIQGSDQDNAE